jgi:hypothetical protein
MEYQNKGSPEVDPPPDAPIGTCFVIILVAGLLLLAAVALLPFVVINGDGPELRTRNELTQLNNAVQNFKSRREVYPPSRIKLCSNRADYNPNDPLDAHSLKYLDRIWPGLRDFKEIAWSGAQLPRGGVVLEGDQCLVFFLGGVPGEETGRPTLLGFSEDPQNPADGEKRRAPLFEFRTSHLVKLRGSPFYSYLDSYGKQPFAYFSTGTRPNGYNPLGSTDCPGLGVWPYAADLGPPVRYRNPESIQIISAGADGKFGPGTVLPDGQPWTPQIAHQIASEGRDDMANFHIAVLGRAQ